MRRYRGGYLSATCHPWSSLVFLLPLLILYEVGVIWLGGAKPEALRNGADTWLRWGLEAFGLPQLYCAPALIIAIFVLWSWLRFWDRPDEVVPIGTGMAVESIVFALGLYGFSRQLGPLLGGLGINLSWGGAHDPAMSRVVTFVGAGIYEEVLFRLLLFFALRCVFRIVALHGLLSALLTAVTSALLFAAAHHVGPYGEAFDRYVFLFRTLAGLYFALLYQFRGFGIAVGTHACYDVLVGVLMA